MKNQKNEETAPTGNRPSHVAYWVKDRGENQKSSWQRVGAAWPHADGKGMNVVLDLMPLDGRITLRTASEEKAE